MASGFYANKIVHPNGTVIYETGGYCGKRVWLEYLYNKYPNCKIYSANFEKAKKHQKYKHE